MMYVVTLIGPDTQELLYNDAELFAYLTNLDWSVVMRVIIERRDV